MNKWIGMGRLTRDPELKTTTNQIAVCSFTIAINRRFKNASGEYEADFLNILAWRQTAEFISKYFHKGNMIGIVGTVQTRNYDHKDGHKVYVTEIVCDEAHFCGEKKDTNSAAPTGNPPTGKVSTEFPEAVAADGLLTMDDDTDLPFDL